MDNDKILDKAQRIRESLAAIRSVMGGVRVAATSVRKSAPVKREKVLPAKIQRPPSKKRCKNGDCGGVGTELTAILTELGITTKPNCPCKSLARKMDREGIDWCKGNLESLVASMQENAKYFAWHEKAGVGLRSLPLIVSGKLNPMRPLDSLIRLAIERAEEKKGTCCAK